MTKAGEADVASLAAGVREGNRTALGRAITLIESHREQDRAHADALLASLLPAAGAAQRVGITGAPGVGKSTFIESLGKQLTAQGHRVAVLAVDPSSARSGGSILGDKTRMQELARDPNAFIRPSPSSGAPGGIARRTRETMVACEAAGYDVMLVETVGVGQSEVAVANMVDFFLVLVLAGGGDELQAIKRGILELADLITVTKADGDNRQAAERARQEYARALHLMQPRFAGWTPRAVSCSALEGTGLDAVWDGINEHRQRLQAAGDWEAQRTAQRRHWMWQALEQGLLEALRSDGAVAAELPTIEAAVAAAEMTPDAAARRLLAVFRGSRA